MSKKFLFIGYGNMTKKYVAIIKKYKKKNPKIKFFSKQKIKDNLYNKYDKLRSYDPDVIFICSATSNHYKDLIFVNKFFKNKIIIVEKPLFHKFYNLKNINNKIFVCFNLRYDPLIQYLKNILKNKKFWSVEIYCKSFLPNWRKNNYTKTYSAKKSLGGGVLLDLSHEFDYLKWIFGNFKTNFVVNNKISNLKINSEDNLIVLGKAKNAKKLLIHLNYYSKIETRSIAGYGKDFDFSADLINKKIIFVNNKNKKYIKTWKEKGFKQSFESLIKDIILNKNIKLPNIYFSLKLQKLISNIQK